MAVLGTINFGILAIVLEGFTPTYFSLDNDLGFFGCYSAENLVTSLLLVGPFSQLLGNSGYVFGLTIAPPELLGSLFLLEPFFGQLAGLIFGLDRIPGTITLLGVLVITYGIYLTAKGSQNREK